MIKFSILYGDLIKPFVCFASKLPVAIHREMNSRQYSEKPTQIRTRKNEQEKDKNKTKYCPAFWFTNDIDFFLFSYIT